MANYKNQHYIPQLYLRNFAGGEERTHIGLHNVETSLHLPRIPLKPQAKEDYFYGKDGVIESYLGNIETAAAPIISQAINERKLPAKESKNYSDLLLFSFLMGNRTVDAAEKIKDTVDGVIRSVAQFDERLKDAAEEFHVYPKNPVGLAIETMLKAVELTIDLRLKLLINITDTKFITSDNPLISYNQFLEQRRHPGGILGLATKGLQVFLPISPDTMLCYYDDVVYHLGDRKQQTISISSSKDVDMLNALQVVECHDKLYFSHHHKEIYIRQLVEKWKNKRVESYSTNNIYHSHYDNEGNEHILLHQHNNDPKLGLQFQFIRQTKKAKEYVLSNYAVQLRDESRRSRSKLV